jgi:transposase-like protein
MSNTRKLKVNKKTRRCPMCRSAALHSKEYSDGTLYACKKCKYPWQELKDKPKSIADKLAAVVGMKR